MGALEVIGDRDGVNLFPIGIDNGAGVDAFESVKDFILKGLCDAQGKSKCKASDKKNKC